MMSFKHIIYIKPIYLAILMLVFFGCGKRVQAPEQELEPISKIEILFKGLHAPSPTVIFRPKGSKGFDDFFIDYLDTLSIEDRGEIDFFMKVLNRGPMTKLPSEKPIYIRFEVKVYKGDIVVSEIHVYDRYLLRDKDFLRGNGIYVCTDEFRKLIFKYRNLHLGL